MISEIVTLRHRSLNGSLTLRSRGTHCERMSRNNLSTRSSTLGTSAEDRKEVTGSPVGNKNPLDTFAVDFAIVLKTASATVTYTGYAPPGTLTSAATWKIKRTTLSNSGNDIAIEWADGNNNFDNVFDNRAGLSYS